MTPARLEANRRNARKSTGPRTTRGKAQARLNGLGRGPRSRFYHDFMMLLMETPPDELERTAQAILTPKEADSRLFKGLVRMVQQADLALVMELRRAHRMGGLGGESVGNERSRNMIENKRRFPSEPWMLLKNNEVSHFCLECS
jgi:hypothetical protein